MDINDFDKFKKVQEYLKMNFFQKLFFRIKTFFTRDKDAREIMQQARYATILNKSSEIVRNREERIKEETAKKFEKSQRRGKESGLSDAEVWQAKEYISQRQSDKIAKQQKIEEKRRQNAMNGEITRTGKKYEKRQKRKIKAMQRFATGGNGLFAKPHKVIIQEDPIDEIFQDDIIVHTKPQQNQANTDKNNTEINVPDFLVLLNESIKPPFGIVHHRMLDADENIVKSFEERTKNSQVSKDDIIYFMSAKVCSGQQVSMKNICDAFAYFTDTKVCYDEQKETFWLQFTQNKKEIDIEMTKDGMIYDKQNDQTFSNSVKNTSFEKLKGTNAMKSVLALCSFLNSQPNYINFLLNESDAHSTDLQPVRRFIRDNPEFKEMEKDVAALEKKCANKDIMRIINQSFTRFSYVNGASKEDIVKYGFSIPTTIISNMVSPFEYDRIMRNAFRYMKDGICPEKAFALSCVLIENNNKTNIRLLSDARCDILEKNINIMLSGGIAPDTVIAIMSKNKDVSDDVVFRLSQSYHMEQFASGVPIQKIMNDNCTESLSKDGLANLLAKEIKENDLEVLCQKAQVPNDSLFYSACRALSGEELHDLLSNQDSDIVEKIDNFEHSVYSAGNDFSVDDEEVKNNGQEEVEL